MLALSGILIRYLREKTTESETANIFQVIFAYDGKGRTVLLKIAS